jgi:uncharacterized protein YraI
MGHTSIFGRSLAIGLFVTVAGLTPTLAFGATGYISARVTMHAGPDPGYPAVRVIHKGEGVEIHGCLADWTWCDVGFNGDRGWLEANKILGESVSGRVPILSAGRDMGIGVVGYNLDEYWDTHYHGRFDRERGRWQSYYHDRHRPNWSRDGDDRRNDDRNQSRDHD